MKSQTEYRKLESLSREIALLKSTAALLGWDQETQLPPAGIDYRARQSAYLAGQMHRMFTAAKVGDWIAACEEDPAEAGSVEAANVREWRRAFDRKTSLPVELVEEFEKTRTRALAAWQSARAASDFAAFRPHLAKLVEMSRRMADCWGYDDCPYDALLEEYETGARTAGVRTLLGELKPQVAELAAEAVAGTAPLPKWLFAEPYPADRQARFNREVAEAFGFDFNAGRIDASTHPFCSGLAPGDTRMTTVVNQTIRTLAHPRRGRRSDPRPDGIGHGRNHPRRILYRTPARPVPLSRSWEPVWMLAADGA